MKRLFVRWFCRFDIVKTASRDYAVAFKLPFLDWKTISHEYFPLKKQALKRIQEWKKNGVELLEAYKS